MLQEKNSCQCVPNEKLFPEEIERSTALMIECLKCGHHVMVRQRGDYSKVRKVIILPEGKPLNLKLIVKSSDYEEFKKFRKQNPNPLLVNVLSSNEKSRDTMYELLADGDITMDQFNDHISRFN